MHNRPVLFATGFTLIELMIVMVVAAILVAIAYPSYSQYVERSRRNDAQARMVELANFLERNYSNAGRYNEDAAGQGTVLPFSESPKGASASEMYYDITVAYANANAFTLTATPENGQTGDECGTMTLTQTGAQTPIDCW